MNGLMHKCVAIVLVAVLLLWLSFCPVYVFADEFLYEEAFDTGDTENNIHTEDAVLREYEISADSLISQSKNISRNGTQILGTYEQTDNAGYFGIDFTISFDWVIEPYGENYRFASVSNVQYDMDVNWLFLSIAHSYYSYEITLWNYSMSSDRTCFTIYLNYNLLIQVTGSPIITSTPVKNTIDVNAWDVI